MPQTGKDSASNCTWASHMARATRKLAIFSVLGAASSTIMAEQLDHSALPKAHLPDPPRGREMGFVVQTFEMTYESNEDDCPEGLTPMLRESFVAELPPAERTRLLKPENATEFRRLYQASGRGPDNTDICTHYDRFNRPPQKMVQGRTAKGFNLDGKSDQATSTGGCAQADFTSPAGETGIDNQVWRAMGCHVRYRGTNGMPPVNFELSFGSLASGENGQVLLLRGVDSLIHDDDVEVIYANTRDAAIRRADGGFIAGASFRISDVPVPNIMRGRITKGVLEATASRLQLRRTWSGIFNGARDLRGARARWNLGNARLRLVFQPDGSVKGLLGGFQPLHDVITPISVSGTGALDTGWDCPAMFAALKAMADGDRDPKTGQCTTISTALQITAVPAFVTTVTGSEKNAVVMRRQ